MKTENNNKRKDKRSKFSTDTATPVVATQEPQKPKQQPIRAEIKIGRNDLCPCGSGKKFKSCHGVNA